MPRSRRLITLFAAASMASLHGASLAACGPGAVVPDVSEMRPDRAQPDDEEPPPEEDVVTPPVDATPAMDVRPDAPLLPSGCPAPPRITPSDVPRTGHMPPVDVTFVRTVDGDTAHFLIGGVETVVRFLNVNAEETHGTETTQFGLETARIIDTYLRPARLQLVREANGTGGPATDTYGRTLAFVFTDGELLQARMTREGLSAYYTAFGCAPQPVHNALLYGEAEARANHRGIWVDGHPTDYSEVLARWIGRSTCRPNPYRAPYCR